MQQNTRLNNIELKVEKRLQLIYKNQYNEELKTRVLKLVNKYQSSNNELVEEKWNEKDVILITYGDSIVKDAEKPLVTLNRFLKNNLKNVLSCVHILPFFPYSSDDGFSVIDYRKVNPDLGNWDHVAAINENFDIMADLVINHISQKSEWFKNFLKQKYPGKDYFIVMDPETDLSKVIRPRSSPLLTKYETTNGPKHLWTTFSVDQVDINFQHPDLLCEMLDVLLFYMKHGTRIIRLDAIAFLWKEPGTSCLHLPETHEVVKLIRDVAEAVNNRVVILTETNVPNKENLSYFGNNDEAHMVYQFSLPPLLLHALHTGNSRYITNWAKKIPVFSSNRTYFNFTASHDGIGVRPLEGLLPENEVKELLENMVKQGGMISTKRNSDGSNSPYEINITYFDALKGTNKGTDKLQTERFICSQTIMMSLQGIPAFYIHSLTATSNYSEGVKQTGRARTINRMKWQENELLKKLSGNQHNAEVFKELTRRIKIRQQYAAFHPSCPQEIIDSGNGFFVISRKTENEKLLVIANIKAENQIFSVSGNNNYEMDLLTNTKIPGNQLQFFPYQVMWLYSGT